MNVDPIDLPIAYGKHLAAEMLKRISGTTGGKNLPIKVFKDHVDFRYRNGKILRFYYKTKAKFINIMTFLDEVFIKNAYESLSIKGKTVVDIGANIGDTALYFILNGAKKVYAYEAVPSIFNAAKKNIAANHLGHKISIFNEAVGYPGKTVTISRAEERASEIKPAREGVNVKCSTLDDVVKRVKAKGMALKLDCEGAEYDLILNASDKALHSFSDIVMEYHYGYKDIAAKLRQVGFSVRVKRPIYVRDNKSKRPDLMLGLLWAHLGNASKPTGDNR